MTAPDTHWYRYEEEATADGADVFLRAYPVLRVSPKGVWLNVYRRQGPRFVLRDAKKQFASATLERAAEAFLARKQRHVRILTAQIGGIELAVDNFKDTGLKARNEEQCLAWAADSNPSNLKVVA